jgi:Rrf2 family nitric oxide-sensitive transcriptional repressor
LQLSLHADYACRVLIYLATMETERASIEAIAAAYGVSQNHLVKVVHRLGKLGFVDTLRGRGGGIKLARPAAEISVGDVIRKTEQPGFAVVECLDRGANTCPITAACGLKPWLAKATAAFLTTLDAVTLAEVAAKRGRLGKVLASS